MSAVIATDTEAEQFLSLLAQICAQQKTISAQLDELILLMQLPSEDVLRVLRELLIPMDQTMNSLNLALVTRFLSAAKGKG